MSVPGEPFSRASVFLGPVLEGFGFQVISREYQDGVEASVVNLRWIKPIDLECVSWAAANHPLIVTVEENTGCGGAGAAVMEALSDLALDRPVLHLGIPDCFVTHGATDRLLAEVGLTASGVRDAVLGRLADLSPAKGRTDAAPGRRRAR